ncbi:capsular polysaccharide export protein, LipB/KpsS family [Profundibacter sp.]
MPDGYKPDTIVPISKLCPLDMQKAYVKGRFLKINTHRAMAARYWYILDQIKPDMLIPWNGYTGHAANALRCYKDHHGLPGGYIERGVARQTVFFDALGVNGAADLSFQSDQPVVPQDQIFASHLQPLADQIRQPQTPRDEKIIFVPLQVEDDSNIIFYSGKIDTMRNLVRYALVLRKCLGEDWRIIVRPHPEEVPNSKLNLPVDPCITVDATTALSTCIAQASVCLTVNSMVGLEAAFQGALSVCLGDGIYCRQSFVIAGQNTPAADVAVKVMQRLTEANPRTLEKLGYLYALQQKYQIGYNEGTTAGECADEWAQLAKALTAKRGKMWQLSNVKQEKSRTCIVKHAPRLQQIAACFDELPAQSKLTVDLLISPTDRLFLTYRDTAIRPTARYVSDMLGKRGFKDFVTRKNMKPSEQAGDIAILSSKASALYSKHKIVLDEYGLPHVNTYVE